MRKGSVYSFLCCSECGVHYVDPLEPQVATQTLFNNYWWTQQYSREYDAYLSLIKRSLERKLLSCEVLTGFRPKSMLDVGCGNGLYAHAGKLIGLNVLGTEVDESSAAVARQHGLDVRVGKLENLDITESFDFVHIKAIVHLCHRPIAMLRSATKRLAEGGVLYVDASHQNGIFSRLRQMFQSEPLKYGQLFPPMHCISYTGRSFRKLLDCSGLSPHRVFTYSAHDPIYYPLLSHSLKGNVARLIKPGIDLAGMGAFLAAYCRASPERI